MLTVYLPDNLVEMGRQNQKHSFLLICPGGGYAMCSQREADLIVYHFLPIGIFYLPVYTMDIRSERRICVCRHR